MVFRLLWGVLGSRYARFAEFIRQPSVVLAYIRALLKAKPIHYIGHNPAGGIAILLLLGSGLVCAISGWLVYADLGGDWLEELHEITSALMLAVVIVHVLAVLLSSYLHQENLLRAMLDGKKSADSKQAIANQHWGVACCLLFAVILVWLLCYADTLHLTAAIGIIRGYLKFQ
jgi:cytochrome b